jgi:hypothetical protein
MRRFVMATVGVVCIACGSDQTSGPPAEVGGGWRLSEVLANQAQAITCTDAGILTLTQSSGSATAVLSQAGTCVQVGGGPIDNSGSASGPAQVGASSIEFVVAQCAYRGSLSGTPPDLADGTVACSGGGLSLSGTWHGVRGGDVTAPGVSATEDAPAGDSVYVPGDTIQIAVDADDNQQLAWVGYRIGDPGRGSDSVPATGRHFSHTFAAPTAAPWSGDIMVFARDADGTPVQIDSLLPTLTGYVRHPTHDFPLTAPVTDIAYDAKRHVIYVSQRDSQRVVALSLDTYTYGTSLAMPSFPSGVDVTPGGDSLLVALSRFASLGVVDLTQNPLVVDTIQLPFDTLRLLKALRIASNGRALVSFKSLSGFDGALDYDLATGAAHLRTDVGIGGQAWEPVVIARSPDRTKLVYVQTSLVPGVPAQVYNPASDAFGGTVGTVDQSAPSVGASTDRFLIGGTVYSSSLTPIKVVFPGSPVSRWPVTAISTDGLYLYVADPGVPGAPGPGYSKVRVSDGVVLERVRLPTPATRLTPLPDGHTLIAATDSLPFSAQTSRLYVVTLP